jgi:uncharacterized protein
MTAAIATLILGFVIGYLGQRSRLCFISGYRDFFLTRDSTLLRGVFGAFLGALGGYILFHFLGGSVPAFPLFAFSRFPSFNIGLVVTILAGLAVGIVGALAGGCPFRMHVLAAEGRKTYWYYLLGFYVGLVFYNVVTSRVLDMIRK